MCWKLKFTVNIQGRYRCKYEAGKIMVKMVMTFNDCWRIFTVCRILLLNFNVQNIIIEFQYHCHTSKKSSLNHRVIKHGNYISQTSLSGESLSDSTKVGTLWNLEGRRKGGAIILVEAWADSWCRICWWLTLQHLPKNNLPLSYRQLRSLRLPTHWKSFQESTVCAAEAVTGGFPPCVSGFLESGLPELCSHDLPIACSNSLGSTSSCSE